MKTEGRNAVLELLKSDKNIDKLLLEKNPQGSLKSIFSEARKRNIRVQFVDRKVLDKESAEGRHQGVIAFCSDFKYSSLDDIINSRSSDGGFVIICDGIEDVHNLGSVIRVAECAGADGVVIPSTNSASVTDAVVRISAGAANHIKVAMAGNINDTIRLLTDSFINVYAADMNGKDITSCRLEEDIAIVIGNEGNGVKPLTQKLCSGTLSIPQYGKVNSLNASVACGIICYETVRQRN